MTNLAVWAGTLFSKQSANKFVKVIFVSMTAWLALTSCGAEPLADPTAGPVAATAAVTEVPPGEAVSAPTETPAPTSTPS